MATPARTVTQAIGAYREVVVSREFKELERLRFEALSNEASALENAERKEREKWQGVVTDLRGAVAEKDTALAEQAALIAELKVRLGEQ
ncbi:MAG: hypothetical protein FWG40_02460 [Peptococcaceae bacterium]|nr:hypothetical protein [Peptococcaceae bacterium]